MTNIDPNAVKITYAEKKFHCHDLSAPGRVVPEAVPIINDLLKELNELPKKYCTTFPWYIFLFLLLWLVSFIVIMAMQLFTFIFVPFVFFIGFMIGMISAACCLNKFRFKVREVTESYRVKLSPYYTIMDYMTIYRGRGYYHAVPAGIYLNPINQMNLAYQNPAMLYQQPNYFANPYAHQNPHQAHIQQPTQPIPIYNPNFNQNQEGFVNYQDQPLNNANNPNEPSKDGRV